MKLKFAITLTLTIFCTLACFAQAPPAESSVSYEFIGVTPDSFFVIRIETATATKESPLPQVVRTPILFRGKSDFETKLKNTRNQTASDRAKAEELKQSAEKLDRMVLDFEDIIQKNEAFFKPKN